MIQETLQPSFRAAIEELPERSWESQLKLYIVGSPTVCPPSPSSINGAQRRHWCRMSEDLVNEIEAIRSIYGDDTIREADGASVYSLSIPHREASLRVLFPPNYPESIPQLLGTERTGVHTRKGYGSHVLEIARATLLSVFLPGSVCLFDLLQELDSALAEEFNGQQSSPADPHLGESPVLNATLPYSPREEPRWILSSAVTEKKSTFIARVCSVTSPAQAQACVAHLLHSDKRAAKATHNISGKSGVTF